MRVFRVENDAIAEEVKTNQRLAGIYDAVHVARSLGDGDYDADFGDGSVMRFTVKNGQPTGIGPESVRNVNLDDMPHRQWDNDVTQQTVRSTVSRLGGMFDDDNQKPAFSRDDAAAVEEF